MSEEKYRVTAYGVTWGNAEIEFVMSDPKFGRCLEIRTATERLQVRVTPGGRFRIGFDRKPWEGSKFEANGFPPKRGGTSINSNQLSTREPVECLMK